uniref:Uncharacterized protein n=1 Tax=Arundo donax TaxID=35708 RepID=A0A0A9FR68_ARUDO
MGIGRRLGSCSSIAMAAQKEDCLTTFMSRAILCSGHAFPGPRARVSFLCHVNRTSCMCQIHASILIRGKKVT